jgi:DnaJ-class molecular chaperone
MEQNMKKMDQLVCPHCKGNCKQHDGLPCEACGGTGLRQDKQSQRGVEK